MKRTISGFFIFVSTLIVGLVSVSVISLQSPGELSLLVDTILISPVEPEVPRHVILAQSEPPIFDEDIDYGKKAQIKLLFTGDFHDDEVPSRTGEKWIGLFRNGSNYELKNTTIVVKETESDGLFNTNVSTKSGGKPLFLLKGSTGLNIGSVSTVFDAEDHEDFTIDNCNYLKSSFQIKGMFWNLCMENAPNGYPEKGTSLILKGPASETVLRSLPNGCNDCTWKLLWAGDLDNDTNLDLLIDVSGHYNVSQPTLFLSSRRNAVFASFLSVGC